MSVGKTKALAAVTGLFLIASFCRAQSQGPPSQLQPGPPSPNGENALSPATPGEIPEEAAELFGKASELILKNRDAESIPLLRRALELAPNQGRIHHYLGYALMRTSQRPAAEKEFETALKLEPGNVYSEYFLAVTLDTEGQRDRALALFEAVFDSGDVIYDTYQHLGQAYARKKEYGKALIMTQHALDLTPWDGALHYQLATIYRQLGQPEEAKQEFATSERMKSVEQSSIQKLLELSESVNSKNWDRVSTLRQELMNQSGGDPDLMTWLGAMLGRSGHYTEALEALRKAKADGPCSYETCYNLGLTLVRMGRKQEAEEPLKQALARHPDSFQVNSILAVVYVEEGRNQEGIERLRAARQAQPENLKVLLLLGQQYLEGWYVQQAIEAFKEALRLKPDDPDIRYLLIEAYEKNVEYDKALEAARETLKLYPQDPRAHLEVGHELTLLGHYQEGRPYFEEALQLEPSFVAAYVFLGDLNIRSGDYEAALRSYQRAKDLDATNMDAVRGVGQSLLRLKRYSQALTELKQSIAEHPDDGELYLQLSEVYGRLGNMEEAQKARAIFDKLHTKEVMLKNTQRPRTFSP